MEINSCDSATLEKQLQLALRIHGFLILGFIQPRIKDILGEKITKSSKNQNLNLQNIRTIFYNIYIVFATIYIALTLY